jgi:probable rRNA maturation factor
VVLNLQSRVRVNIGEARRFSATLRRTLKLGRRELTVCFVDDRAIRQLNREFRGKDRPTDVLSFPWQNGAHGYKDRRKIGHELRNYLGDIVISTETARENARSERHSTSREIHWLILHGTLHLLGHDHAKDSGEMTRLEHQLRARLRIE